jgi:sugar-specific transcriptional regulator TrmB
LLSKGVASVGEIAEISGVPRSRVYDVLESLEKKGFAVVKLGKPVKFIAIKPAIVLDRLKNNYLKEANEKVKNLDNVRGAVDYKELENLYTNGIEPVQVEELTSAIKGRSNVYSHIKDMVANAQKEVILVSTPIALKRKSTFLKPLFEKLKEKGVNISVASNEGEDMATLMNLSKQIGVPIKKTKINARFLVIDNSKMLVMITPEDVEESDIAVLINSSFFARTLTGLLPAW